MEIKEFNSAEHLPTLLSWLVQRKAYIPTAKEMPEVGFVISIEQPTAMIFLRKVEGGYGMIDGLTTNPSTSSEERDIAIEMGIQLILDKAQDIGITKVIAFTNEENLTERVVRGFEFTAPSHQLLVFNSQ